MGKVAGAGPPDGTVTGGTVTGGTVTGGTVTGGKVGGGTFTPAPGVGVRAIGWGGPGGGRCGGPGLAVTVATTSRSSASGNLSPRGSYPLFDTVAGNPWAVWPKEDSNRVGGKSGPSVIGDGWPKAARCRGV
jgi:hypothetical protein